MRTGAFAGFERNCCRSTSPSRRPSRRRGAATSAARNFAGRLPQALSRPQRRCSTASAMRRPSIKGAPRGYWTRPSMLASDRRPGRTCGSHPTEASSPCLSEAPMEKGTPRRGLGTPAIPNELQHSSRERRWMVKAEAPSLPNTVSPRLYLEADQRETVQTRKTLKQPASRFSPVGRGSAGPDR
jgi:hypothetical protein